MSKEVIKTGKFVSLTYSIVEGEGNVLEQSDLPVNYIHGGETELIGGMDAAVKGRSPGDNVSFTLTPDQCHR